LGHSSDERNYTPTITHKEAHGALGTEQAAETVQLAALRDIYLTAESMPKGDLLEGITVTSGDRSRQFDWATVANPTYSPRLYAANLNTDANDEIIVILSKGTGTGVLEEDIHVLDAMLNEILVEDGAHIGPSISCRFYWRFGSNVYFFRLCPPLQLDPVCRL
jgi:hypothetical protein